MTQMRCELLICLFLVGCKTAPPEMHDPPSSEVTRTTADGRAVSEATADDRAVMSAVLDGALRAERDRSIRAGRGATPDPAVPTDALFLVLDSTVPSCSPEVMGLGNPILSCFDVRKTPLQQLLEEFACEQDGRTAGAMLARRNGSTLAIRGSLGKDVVSVSADTVNGLPRLSELRRRYPLGSTVVTFSAPIYPKAGVAVVYYHMFEEGYGFVCLVRSENPWSVHTRKNRVE